MEKLIIFTVVILSANALSHKALWENFKIAHGKVYKNPMEERSRFSIFLSNLKTINEHNEKYELGLVKYEKGINQFADLTQEEFKSKLGLQLQKSPTINMTRHVPDLSANIPDSLDWREKGAVLEVKDQGDCKDGWAFSAAAAIEGQYYIKNGKSVSLSPQNLLDCIKPYGTATCENGNGLPYQAYEYVRDHGIESESDYPYSGSQGQCQAEESKTVAHIQTYRDIAPNEEALRQAVATIGPISASFCSFDLSQFYQRGIFDEKYCQSFEVFIDHAVLVVGYGEENGTPYWLLKNSWGKTWGEDGYMRLERNANLCGLTLKASYPIL